LLNRSGKWALNDEGAYFNDPELQDFRLWAEEKGKRTYVAFLLHHPGYLAIEPFKPIFNMMNMDLSMYKSREFESSFPGKLWGRLVNKKTIPIFVIASLVFGIFLIFLKGRNRNLSIAAMAIGLLAIPQYVISCHGDAMEVERHCLFSIVQWHLAFILFSIVLIDYLVIKYSPSNKELETYKKIQKIKCVL